MSFPIPKRSYSGADTSVAQVALDEQCDEGMGYDPAVDEAGMDEWLRRDGQYEGGANYDPVNVDTHPGVATRCTVISAGSKDQFFDDACGYQQSSRAAARQ